MCSRACLLVISIRSNETKAFDHVLRGKLNTLGALSWGFFARHFERGESPGSWGRGFCLLWKF